jgi:predicted permease
LRRNQRQPVHDQAKTMRTILREIRHELRHLLRMPAFTATAVLTLSLGIGATTAIYSVVEGVLLRPLPFADPQSLVELGNSLEGTMWDAPQVPAYQSIIYARDTHSFLSLGAYQQGEYELSGPVSPAEIGFSRINAGVFRALGVLPLMGRVFSPEEDEGSAQVAVISYDLWRNRFDSDAKIIGTKVQLDRKPYVVIGVMPRGFEFPLLPGQLNRSELWVPMSFTQGDLAGRGDWNYQMVGRLKPGISPVEAQRDAQRVAEDNFRQNEYAWGATHSLVRRLDEVTVAASRPLIRTLFLAVIVVLFVACSNLTGLVLVRAIRRNGELALRLALGAGRTTILRQNLIATLALSFSAGLLGLGIAAAALRVCVRFLPETTPRMASIHLDWPVVGFAVLLALLTGVGCGVLSAMATMRTNLYEALKDGQAATSRGGSARLRSALVVAQLALALALAAAAGLLLRSFEKLRAIDLGFRSDHVLTAGYDLPEEQYSTQASVDAFIELLLTKLRQMPIVVSVGITSTLPGTRGDDSTAFVPSDYAPPPGKKSETAWRAAVLGDYFSAQGIPLIRGRVFTDADRADSPMVIIVNRTFTEHYWPGKDPIGKRIHFGGTDPSLPWMTVVGEIGDLKQGSPDQDTRPQVYQPASQVKRSFGKSIPSDLLNSSWGSIVLRSAIPPEQMAESLRLIVRSIDPQLPLIQMESMEDVVGDGRAPRRFVAGLISSFASIAVALAALGVYSIVAFSAASRRREMAIRLALGSRRSNVMRLILFSGIKLGVAGCFLGAFVTIFATRLLRSFLFQINPLDPWVLVLVTLFVLVLAVLASLTPARQAASVEPMETLRVE